MKNSIQQYDLYKDNPKEFPFAIFNAKAYFTKSKAHASVPHRHSFYQVIWFKKAGRHYVDYQTLNHSKNTLFFINKNQIHYFCADAPNEGYLFHFNDEFINKQSPMMTRFSLSIFNEIGSSYLQLTDEDAKKIGLLTSYIELEMLGKKNYYKDQVYHFFQTILFQIERLRQKDGSINLDHNPEYKLALDFKNLVFKEINEFHSIDYYAEELGTNTKTLTEVTKEVLRETPANFIKDSKLLEAKRMLVKPSTSIKEVAYALGFNDPTYFTKYFKKDTGYTPKAFQKLDFQKAKL